MQSFVVHFQCNIHMYVHKCMIVVLRWNNVLFVFIECMLSSTPHSLSAEEDEGVQTEWGFISDDVHRTHSAVHANPMSLQPLSHHGTGTERSAAGFCHRMHYVLCMDLPLSLTCTHAQTHVHTCTHTCTNTRAHIRTLTNAHGCMHALHPALYLHGWWQWDSRW